MDRRALSLGQSLPGTVPTTVALDTDFTNPVDRQVHDRYAGDDEERLRAHLQDDLAYLDYDRLSVVSWVVARVLTGAG